MAAKTSVGPFATLALVSLLVGPPSVGQARPQSFCARLAPSLSMKTVARRSDIAASSEWKVNLVNLGQALFGGSVVVSMAVEPVGDAPAAAEFTRLQDSCDATPKGARCEVVGPAKFTAGTKKGKVSAEANAAEQATVEMRGTTILCRDR